jgi:dipeptidyl aminopeptidase/acylaminoacyl peptidase
MYVLQFRLALILNILLTSIVLKAQNPQVYLNNIQTHWQDDNTHFWYRKDLKEGQREFVLVNAATGKKKAAFDHEKVAKLLGEKPKQLPFDELTFSNSSEIIHFYSYDGKGWAYDPTINKIQPLDAKSDRKGGIPADSIISSTYYGSGSTSITFRNDLDKGISVYWVTGNGERIWYRDLDPDGSYKQGTGVGHFWLITEQGRDTAVLAAFRARKFAGTAIVDEHVPVPVNPKVIPPEETVVSPDGKKEAFVRDENLWLREIESGTETQLSSDGTKKLSYHRNAARERTIWLEYNNPDYPSSLPEVYWSPDSKRLIAMRTKVISEPRVYLKAKPGEQASSYPYLRPGAEVPTKDVRLFDAVNKKEIPVDQSLWPNQWSLGTEGWKDGVFRVMYNQRGHQVLRFIAIDGSSGAIKTLIEENSKTFIDYSRKFFMQELENKDEIIWMSERDGWNHLYAFDAKQGGLKRQITKGKWMVRYVDHIDEEQGLVWFWAGGVYPEQDPYYLHLCRAKLDGSEWEILTEGNGNHSIEWSPDSTYFIDTWSRVDQPSVHELRRSSDGKLVLKLEEADASELLDSGYRFPETFVATGRDDSTQIYGIIHYPNNFDPNASYPVIEAIYAGPHGAHVPKSFSPRSYSPGNLGTNGYVVVQIDGMGTNYRSKAFHDMAWKNIKDAGFPDRIRWIKSAAKERPWMNLDHVGIFGGSAGGQNAMRAVIDHADFYKAAAADCGCHDNRLDKIWWNEAWMGWPVDKSYEQSSNIVDAPNLKGELLLTVGERDKNVPPESTYKLVEALEKANKRFEYFPIEDYGHGAGEGRLGMQKRIEFFNKHLKK